MPLPTPELAAGHAPAPSPARAPDGAHRPRADFPASPSRLAKLRHRAENLLALARVVVRHGLGRPTHPSWPLDFDLAVALTRSLLTRDARGNALGFRRHVASVPRALQGRIRVTHTQIASVSVDIVEPAGDAVRPTLLFLHGGGYVSGSPASHRDLFARIADAAQVRIVAPDYRLAPEAPYPAAFEDALAVYRGLLTSLGSPAQLYLGGDSAGGGLAAACLLALRDAGDALPRCAVLLSPWVDLSLDAQTLAALGPHDYLSAQGVADSALLYAGGASLREPTVSPVFGDLHGLCPLLVQTGELEIFRKQNEAFVARARAHGVDVQHILEPGMVHVHASFAVLTPAAQRAVHEIAAYLAAQR